MHYIGKTKIGQKRSKPTIVYPLIRLPKELAEVIGTPANIYQTACEGSTAFIVLLSDKEGKLPKGEDVQFNAKVGQLAREVGQPSHKKDLEASLSALELELKDLKRLFFKGEGFAEAYSEKQKAEGEIRTRVVASTGP